MRVREYIGRSSGLVIIVFFLFALYQVSTWITPPQIEKPIGMLRYYLVKNYECEPEKEYEVTFKTPKEALERCEKALIYFAFGFGGRTRVTAKAKIVLNDKKMEYKISGSTKILSQIRLEEKNTVKWGLYDVKQEIEKYNITIYISSPYPNLASEVSGVGEEQSIIERIAETKMYRFIIAGFIVLVVLLTWIVGIWVIKSGRVKRSSH